MTTKLWNTYANRAEEGLNDSLKNLGLDYVDLYLVHWPVRMNDKGITLSLPHIHVHGGSYFSTGLINVKRKSPTLPQACGWRDPRHHPRSQPRRYMEINGEVTRNRQD